MAFLPLLMNEVFDEHRQPSFGNIYDQNFGLGLLGDDLLLPSKSFISMPLRSGYVRPWRVTSQGDSGVSNVSSNKEEFKINLDVQQFKPDELKVKVVDNSLIVEGKHEERADQHGFISREFRRRYTIPNDFDVKALKSTLSSDGILILVAPKKTLPNASTREIPILQTNAPAVKSQKEGGTKEEPTEKVLIK